MKPLALTFAFLAIAATISGLLGNYEHFLIAIMLGIIAAIASFSYKNEQDCNTSPKKVFIIGDHVMITDCYSVRCHGIVKAVTRDTVRVEFTDSQGEYHNALYLYDQIFPLKNSISKL